MRKSSGILALAFALACSGSDSSQMLNGAGATFPYPIYSKWFSDYATQTGVKINYQSIGSGGGIRQLQAGIVDFGASDSPMSDEELGNAKHGHVLHFPTVLGAVVITYNLPDVTTPLKLTGDVVADIFMGRITQWSDPRIVALNPDVTLPSEPIIVVHRSDGSGTTYVFTDFLDRASQSWSVDAGGPGRGKEVQWPVGLGGKGNEGVAGQVKQTPSSIGYVELAYARQNNLPAAMIRNSSGAFIEPSTASITAAAAGAASLLTPDSDYRISIANGPGEGAYPISSFTWLLVYETPPDPDKGRTLVEFLRWMYSVGQNSAAALDYAPLPEALAQQLTDRLTAIKLSGSS